MHQSTVEVQQEEKVTGLVEVSIEVESCFVQHLFAFFSACLIPSLPKAGNGVQGNVGLVQN